MLWRKRCLGKPDLLVTAYWEVFQEGQGTHTWRFGGTHPRASWQALAQTKYAVEYELREDNPVTGIGKLKTRTGGIASWSEKEIRQFEEYHPVGTEGGSPLVYFCTRGSAAATSSVSGGNTKTTVGFFQATKTGAEMAIPISHELREILNAGPVGDLILIL